MCLIRYSSDSAFSCGSVVLLPVRISVLHITLWLRCLLFITIAVICQKWYQTGFQRTPLLHLFIWNYFHRKVQVIFNWMLFQWKIIAWKSRCLPAPDRKVCRALQRCNGGALWHVIQAPCLLTLLSDGESSVSVAVGLWILTCHELDEIFFFCSVKWLSVASSVN